MYQYLLILTILVATCLACEQQNVTPSNSNKAVALDTIGIKNPIETKDYLVDYDTAVWTEIQADDHIKLDLRYATLNNFTKEIIYDCDRCFLRKASARVFNKVVAELKQKGYGVKLFDCYRPLPAQVKLWHIVPNPMYVADPKKGSMHNRGLALDLTLTDAEGNELDMGTGFDFFGNRAYHDFLDLSQDILERRILLKKTMAKFGFKHTRTEWWHYSDTNNKGAISNFQWPCPN